MITSTIDVRLNGNAGTLNVMLDKNSVFVLGSLFQPCLTFFKIRP